MLKSICFPGLVTTLRKDEKFKDNAYVDDYQRSESILNKIPRLGLVTGVLLDPMHIV